MWKKSLYTSSPGSFIPVAAALTTGKKGVTGIFIRTNSCLHYIQRADGFIIAYPHDGIGKHIGDREYFHFLRFL